MAARAALWANETFRANHRQAKSEFNATPEQRRRMSEAAKAKWADPAYRAKHKAGMTKACVDPEYKRVRQEASLAAWADPELRKRHAAAMKKLHTDPAYQAAYRAGLAKRQMPSGKEHPLYKDGMGGNHCMHYPPEFNAALKLAVRQRDGFCCILCGKPEDDRAHICHHIDDDITNNQLSNLLSLCLPCHSTIHNGKDFDAYRVGFQALFPDNDPAETAP